MSSVSKIKIQLLSTMHDSFEYNFILKGLYFHFFILTGSLLYNHIPVLITLFKKKSVLHDKTCKSISFLVL